MPTRSVDLVAKRILNALGEQPGATPKTIAQMLGLQEEVVRTRLVRLHEEGILQAVVRIDAAKVGMPHEVMVQGTPSGETTREALDRLCAHPGVTRVLTLASRRSIAFTVRGDDLERVQRTAAELAMQAGLLETEASLVVQTLHDDAGRGIGRALQGAV